MDVTAWAPVISAATAFVVALSGAVVLIIKAIRDVKDEVKADVQAVSVKTEKIAQDQGTKLTEIGAATDGNLTRLREEIAQLRVDNKLLLDESIMKNERQRTEDAARVEKLELLLAATHQAATLAASQAASQVATLAAGQSANQATNVPVGALGSSDFVQKIEIQQPADKPVPVVETSRPK